MNTMTFRTMAVVVLLMLPAAGRLSAQGYSNAISGDLLSLASWGGLNATFEHRTATMNSFTIFASFWAYEDWEAPGIGASFRWYINLKDGKRALQGLSAGPLISIGFWRYHPPKHFDDYYYDYPSGTTIGIGGELAYKWVFGGFAVEPILRVLLAARRLEHLPYRGFGLGLNLGYAW